MRIPNSMYVHMIWATDPNGYIGDGRRPVIKSNIYSNIFRDLTSRSKSVAVVMSRKKFESFGCKPLPNVLNIVLSKKRTFGFSKDLEDGLEDLHLARSLSDVFSTCDLHDIEDLWVLGGKKVYEQFLELADKLYVISYDNYSDIEPEKAIQFLPDLAQFNLFSSRSFIDKTITGTFDEWERRE